MKTQSVLVNGNFSGFEKGLGYIDIDRIYNPMPPISRYIYPFEPLQTIEDFE